MTDPKPIPGHQHYLACADGSIESISRVTIRRGHPYRQRGRKLKPWLAGSGYLYVQLGFGGPKTGVHRLVCLAFHGAPTFENAEAAHRNGIKIDNRPENLRWLTRTENEREKMQHGTYFIRGIKHRKANDSAQA
ncbi:MAG TPA: HNH endonuclease signature motif containing protein [Burkholderiales bacterium]